MHLSNILSREEYRRTSHVAAAATAVITGAGADGYVMALQAAARLAGRGNHGDTAMISAGELRPGNTVERQGELLQVLEFAHNKQGRGTAIVRAKFKNLQTGAVTEETFRPEEKFGRARIERSEAQYLYQDGDDYVVMDTTTYDQFPLTPAQLGDARRYLKENDNLFLLTYDGAGARHRPPHVRRAGGDSDRPGVQGRHRQRGLQAGHRGDRPGGRRSAVRQRGRPHPRRHAHRASTWRGCDERDGRRPWRSTTAARAASRSASPGSPTTWWPGSPRSPRCRSTASTPCTGPVGSRSTASCAAASPTAAPGSSCAATALRIDLWIVMEAGANVAAVGAEVQGAVGDAIRRMLGLPLAAVNVFVSEVVFT